MKNRITEIGKWLALAVVVVAAGLCYSCGRQQAQPVFTVSEGAELSASLPEERKHETEPEPETVIKAAVGTEAVCYVHVCGEVVQPGVYMLAEGARIRDAVEQAGGFTERAAADYLNLAEQVYDGMKLAVPDLAAVPETTWAAPELAGEPVQGGSGAAEEGRINLNSATKEQLMTLPGIGEKRAEDIIRYREQHGGFQSAGDVMQVPGIKEAAFGKIRDRITVSD